MQHNMFENSKIILIYQNDTFIFGVNAVDLLQSEKFTSIVGVTSVSGI